MANKYPYLYVVMFKGCDGWLHSFDTGNPFRHKRTAQRALAAQGKEKAQLYTIVRYAPTSKPAQ